MPYKGVEFHWHSCSSESALRARSFSAASWQIPGTCSIFYHGRKTQLAFGVFGFRWIAQRNNFHKFALVPVNAKYIAPLKLTMNQAEGALRARSFSAASWQIPGTCSIFFHGTKSQLTFGAFAFRWIAHKKKITSLRSCLSTKNTSPHLNLL